jgi:hypothetical protein
MRLKTALAALIWLLVLACCFLATTSQAAAIGSQGTCLQCDPFQVQQLPFGPWPGDLSTLSQILRTISSESVGSGLHLGSVTLPPSQAMWLESSRALKRLWRLLLRLA